MTNLKTGDQWGSLTVLEIFTDVVETKRNGVTDRIPSKFYTFGCNCGGSKTVAAGMFPGRRKMRDCGCGSGEVSHGQIRSAYIDDETYAGIERYADEQDITVSKAIVRLCRAGLGLDKAKAGVRATQSVSTAPTPNPTPTSTSNRQRVA